MKEIEFDLLTEPWIRVRLKDNTVQEVSLTEALGSAMERAVAAGAFPGRTYPGLSGTVEGPLLALPPDAPLLAGAGSKNRHGVWGGQAQRRNVGKQQ